MKPNVTPILYGNDEPQLCPLCEVRSAGRFVTVVARDGAEVFFGCSHCWQAELALNRPAAMIFELIRFTRGHFDENPLAAALRDTLRSHWCREKTP